MHHIQLLASLCLLTHSVTGVVLEIDGWIDYEPNTKVLSNLVSKLSKISKLDGSLETVRNKKINSDEDDYIVELREPQTGRIKVKENKDVVDFIYSVYHKSLTMLRRVALRTDENMQPEIDEMNKEFKERFEAFMNKTLEQNMQTSLAIKKITLNTVEYTKTLLERLANELTENLKKKNSTRLMQYSVKQMHHEIHKNTNETRDKLCKEFGFCDLPGGFVDFLISVLNQVANSEKNLIRNAVNLFMNETLKNATGNIFSENELNKFNRIAHYVRKKNATQLRGILRHLIHNLSERNKPMVLPTRTDLIKEQQAFYEIMDTLEENIKPTDENTEFWKDIKNRLHTWSATRSGDITDIVKDFIRHIKDKGIRTMSGYQWVNVKQNLRTLISNKEHWM